MNPDLNIANIPTFNYSDQRDAVLFLIYMELYDFNLQNHFSQIGLDLTPLTVDLGEGDVGY